MKNPTTAAATPTDLANDEAMELRKACRYEEAAAALEAHLSGGGPLDDAEQLRTRNNLAMLARDLGDYAEALRVHKEARPFADACRDSHPLLVGHFSYGRAITLERLGGDENRDRAIIEFTAASYFYEAAGDWPKKRDVENSLAVLHAEAGRAEKAMEHFALALGSGPRPTEDVLAQYEDTRALIELARGNPGPAVDYAYSSLSALRRSGDENLLAGSVRTLVRAGRAYLDELEERRLRAALEAAGWNITRAAKRLGFSRQAFKHHLRRHFPRLDRERRNRSVSVKRGS